MPMIMLNLCHLRMSNKWLQFRTTSLIQSLELEHSCYIDRCFTWSDEDLYMQQSFCFQLINFFVWQYVGHSQMINVLKIHSIMPAYAAMLEVTYMYYAQNHADIICQYLALGPLAGDHSWRAYLLTSPSWSVLKLQQCMYNMNECTRIR